MWSSLKEQDKLIKEKQDAIQESKTEEQVLSDDGGSKETGETDKVELQGVGKGDTRQTTVTDEKTLTPEQQVKSDELNKKRDEKIDQESRRFVVPGTKIQVQMNADGTANPVALKENTDKPVNKSSQAKANKMILENVIDVNAGDKLDLEGNTYFMTFDSLPYADYHRKMQFYFDFTTAIWISNALLF